MSVTTMTQSSFAKLIGTNRKNICTYVNKGIISGYGDNNEVKQDEALRDLVNSGKIDDKGKFIKKSASSKTKQMKVKDLPAFHFSGAIKTTEIDDEKKKILIEKGEEFSKRKRVEEENKEVVHEMSGSEFMDIDDTDMPSELVSLLLDIDDSSKRVQIMKDFWSGKIQKQKFMKEKGELILVNDAKAVVEMLYHPFSKKLDNFHVDIKARFPDVQIEAIEWIQNELNDLKKSVQGYAWES